MWEMAVRWQGVVVGRFTDDLTHPPGGWYARGPWQPSTGPRTAEFETLAERTDGQPRPEPRVWVELLERDSEDWRFLSHGLIVFLRDGLIEVKIMWESRPPSHPTGDRRQHSV